MSVAEQRDVPGVIAPPPLIYAGALAIGLALEALLPSPEIDDAVALSVGIPLLVAGGLFAGSFLTGFRRAGTPVDPGKPSTSLVTTGAYRVTRNPGYLGLALTYAGIAALVPAPWAFATLVPALAAIDRGVIAREERYLDRRFGDAYRAYKARTRRWL